MCMCRVYGRGVVVQCGVLSLTKCAAVPWCGGVVVKFTPFQGVISTIDTVSTYQLSDHAVVVVCLFPSPLEQQIHRLLGHRT